MFIVDMMKLRFCSACRREDLQLPPRQVKKKESLASLPYNNTLTKSFKKADNLKQCYLLKNKNTPASTNNPPLSCISVTGSPKRITAKIVAPTGSPRILIDIVEVFT